MKHVCVAARIGVGEALDAGNIQNIGKSSNDASAEFWLQPLRAVTPYAVCELRRRHDIRREIGA